MDVTQHTVEEYELTDGPVLDRPGPEEDVHSLGAEEEDSVGGRLSVGVVTGFKVVRVGTVDVLVLRVSGISGPHRLQEKDKSDEEDLAGGV